MNYTQYIVEGKEYSRTVWFSPGPKQTSHPLCVFMDGEFYLKMELPAILERLIASGRIPVMSFAIVAHNGGQSRHEDYVCNDRFARFIAEDLVLWAKNEVETIQLTENVVCGLSLSGLASAHIQLIYPHIFSSCLSQSGSFWWNRKRFADLVYGHSLSGSRFWLSVGDEENQESATHAPSGMLQEFSQIAGVQSAADALRAAGAAVEHKILRGGHALEPWALELPAALEWLTGNHSMAISTEAMQI